MVVYLTRERTMQLRCALLLFCLCVCEMEEGICVKKVLNCMQLYKRF